MNCGLRDAERAGDFSLTPAYGVQRGYRVRAGISLFASSHRGNNAGLFAPIVTIIGSLATIPDASARPDPESHRDI